MGKTVGIVSLSSGVLGEPFVAHELPMDDTHHAAYKEALLEVIPDRELPIVCNLQVGHAPTRCILPFGVRAAMDADAQRITFAY